MTDLNAFQPDAADLQWRPSTNKPGIHSLIDARKAVDQLGRTVNEIISTLRDPAKQTHLSQLVSPSIATMKDGLQDGSLGGYKRSEAAMHVITTNLTGISRRYQQNLLENVTPHPATHQLMTSLEAVKLSMSESKIYLEQRATIQLPALIKSDKKNENSPARTAGLGL